MSKEASQKLVKFNDGEAIEPADWTLMQNIARFENHIRMTRNMRGGVNAIDSSLGQEKCWTLGVPPKIIPYAALQSSVSKGLIVHCTDLDDFGITGEETFTRWAYLHDNDVIFTHTTAHATLERIDLICFKLDDDDDTVELRHFESASTRAITSQNFDKRTSTVLSTQVVAGTPAAVGSAVAPAVPAGWCAFASVIIPPTFAANFDSNTHLNDLTLPLGPVQSGYIYPNQFWNQSWGSGASLAGVSNLATGAAQVTRCILPFNSPEQRIRVLDFYGKITSPGKIELVRLLLDNGAYSETVLGDLGHTTGALAFKTVVNDFILGTTAQKNRPIWGHTRHAIGGFQAGTPNEVLALRITSGANADAIVRVGWSALEGGHL